MRMQEIADAIELFIDYGCTDVKSYTLVNNYGYTFKYDGVDYDARFWANCYGVAVNEWEIHSSQVNAKEIPAMIELEKALNEKCR